jgi:hypothetical protein
MRPEHHSANPFTSAARAPVKDPNRSTLVILLLIILLTIVAATRLAIAPVFVYYPGFGSTHPVPFHAQPHEGAHLLFGGPYYQLQAGGYRAAFRVRNGPAQVAVLLARLEVVIYSNSGTRVVTGDLPAITGSGDSYHEEELAFRLPVTSDIETRVFYTGAADLWVDGVRIWPEQRSASVPVVAILLAFVGGPLLVIAAIRRARKSSYWLTLILAKICFLISAAILITAAERCGTAVPLNGNWLLPPTLWILGPLGGGAVILFALQRLTGVFDSVIWVADTLGDALVVALVAWTIPQFSIFALAAIAVATWMCKLALMVFVLARSRRNWALPAAIAVATFTFVGVLPWYHHYSTSGDQTSYLVETLSLLHHKRVNTWEVIESGEYREFAPSTDRHLLEIDTITVGGVPGFPARDFGVPVLSLPGYLFGKADGARLTMELAAVLLAGVVFSLIARLGLRWDASVLAWAAVCFSVPMLHFSSMLYPEVLGGLLSAVGLLLLDRPVTPRSALLVGGVIGLLPVMSARYWALAAPLALLCVFRFGEARRWDLLPLLGAPLVTLLTLEVFVNNAVYGIHLPNAGYFLVLRGVSPAIYNQRTPFTLNFVKGWLGIWLDRFFGAFGTAPVFLLALAGVPVLWLRSRQHAVRILALIVPYFVAVASTTFWTGGGAALPRYLVPVLPLFALPLATILDRRFRLLGVAFTAVGALTAMASLTNFDSDHAVMRLASRCFDSFGFTTASLLPSLATAEVGVGSVALTIVWLSVGLAIAVIAWKSQVAEIAQARSVKDIKSRTKVSKEKLI